MDKPTAIKIIEQLASKYKGYPSEHDAITKAIDYLKALAPTEKAKIGEVVDNKETK